MVDCHKIAQELSTRIETDIEGEFSYKTNKISEIKVLLAMMFYSTNYFINYLETKPNVQISMVGCHNIAHELSTRIETDIDGEFSYKINNVLELIMILAMMFY